MLNLLAFDYGASSGRAILGGFNGETLQLEEIHRFSNDPVTINGSFHWDILRLFHELKQGILKCAKSGRKDIAGIGVDTWGVDFGLLGASGEMLGNPFHYRDRRTDGMLEQAYRIVPKRDIYDETGIQLMQINTLYQLLSMKLGGSPLLEKASDMLLMPDLLNYFLTGVKASERTIVSTTQMYDPRSGKWAKTLLYKLGLPTNILTDIIETGSIVGNVSRDICDELGIGSIPVIAIAEHDTGSAVVSVPAVEGSYAYLSSGTWSLLGIESQLPVINDTTYNHNFTNEGGINNTTRLLKNIMGLWIYQECKRTWDKEGDALTFDELEMMASKSEPFAAFIDPDDDMFLSPGHMPDKVREFCRHTGQIIPESKAAVVRCIMESLAFKYRVALEGLDKVVGSPIPVIHIVGGGSRNTMLCRFTANATGRPVIAGPVEATAVGNLSAQLIALGEISSLKDARTIVKRSFPTSEYLPENGSRWNEEYSRFVSVLETKRAKGMQA